MKSASSPKRAKPNIQPFLDAVDNAQEQLGEFFGAAKCDEVYVKYYIPTERMMIVPVVALDNAEDAIPLAHALLVE